MKTKFIISIIALIVAILYTLKLIINKHKEHFTETNAFKELGEVMNQLSPDKQNSQLLGTVDKMQKDFKDSLVFDKSAINQGLLDTYVSNLISNDNYNTDKKLKTKESDKLPKLSNNDIKAYNNKLRILINSKKLKQDYILKVLKYKLKKQLDSLKRVTDIK